MVIWVQVHDVLMGFMSKFISKLIGTKLRSELEVDPNTLSSFWRSYMRIHVSMDAYRPLKQFLRIRLVKGEPIVLTLKYE